MVIHISSIYDLFHVTQDANLLVLEIFSFGILYHFDKILKNSDLTKQKSNVM